MSIDWASLALVTVVTVLGTSFILASSRFLPGAGPGNHAVRPVAHDPLPLRIDHRPQSPTLRPLPLTVEDVLECHGMSWRSEGECASPIRTVCRGSDKSEYA